MPRLVLWNVDHTLVDVGRVTRDAYAEAFAQVTGRPLVRLAPTAGRTESEIIFETLAFNDVVTTEDHLAEFIAALGDGVRRPPQVDPQGRPRAARCARGPQRRRPPARGHPVGADRLDQAATRSPS